MNWQNTVMIEKKLLDIADEACNKSEKEGNCKTGDSCMDCRLREKAVAKAQAEITAEQTAREIVEEIRKFCNKPHLYHYRCWGSGMVLIRDEWGDEPTYKCHSYDGGFNCGCRKCPWEGGVIDGGKELQDFERHQNSIIGEIIHSLKDSFLKGD